MVLLVQVFTLLGWIESEASLYLVYCIFLGKWSSWSKWSPCEDGFIERTVYIVYLPRQMVLLVQVVTL